MKRILSLVLSVIMVIAIIPVSVFMASAEETVVTITFDNVAKRTQKTTTKQVWEENGITVTNNKGSSTSSVNDAVNPVRFYASSELIIEYPSITKIVVVCGSSGYASAMSDSLKTVSGCTTSVSSSTVTATFATPLDSINIAKMTAQSRVKSMTIYSESAAQPDCEHINVTQGDCTNNTVCDDCGEVLEYASGHVFVDGFCACGEEAPKGPADVHVSGNVVAEFQFGENQIDAEHTDGSTISTSYDPVDGAYTLDITAVSRTYGGGWDKTGRTALKLGTSGDTGSFSFAVPEDITEVVIRAAKYKTNASVITVNDISYTLTKNSDNGAYEEIVVDTTEIKTITIATTSSGKRAMIDSISFIKPVSEGTIKVVATQKTDVNGGTYNVRFVAAVGELVAGQSKVGFVIETEASGGKRWEKQNSTVYEAINANYGADQISASSEDAAYLAALAITGVPADLGAITFVVTPYVIIAGETVYGEAVTVKVTPTYPAE